jgi:hypothetical protein
MIAVALIVVVVVLVLLTFRWLYRRWPGRAPSGGRQLGDIGRNPVRYFGEMASENDLRRAEELVAEGRRIVQQQKGRIIRLRAAGIDTWNAQKTLHLFEANLQRFEVHRDFLKAEK